MCWCFAVRCHYHCCIQESGILLKWLMRCFSITLKDCFLWRGYHQCQFIWFLHAVVVWRILELSPLTFFLPISMLCGEGARLWAVENGLKSCDPDDLLTGKTCMLDIVCAASWQHSRSIDFGNTSDDTRAMYLEHKFLLDQVVSHKREDDEPPGKKLKFCDYDAVSTLCILSSS